MSIENLEKVIGRREIHNSFNPIIKDDIKNDLDEIKYFDVNSLLDTALKDIKDTKKVDFISYGYNFLDNHLGGIYKSDLIIIGGETGTGKTVFANNIALKSAKNHKVAIWSLEDDPVSILKNKLYTKINSLRLKDNKTRYPFISFWKNELETMEFYQYRTKAYNELQKELNGNILYVDVNQTPTIDLLEKQIIELSKKGVEMLVIDHLHKFNFKQQGKSNKSDAIEEFMNRLRLVQGKTGMRVILLVHYTKLNGAKPILDSFKDSIAIPQNASVVINLWRDRGQTDNGKNETGITKIMLPKIRIPVPEVTFEAKFNQETNDYEDDIFVFGTEQGDKYKEAKEKELKKNFKNKL